MKVTTVCVAGCAWALGLLAIQSNGLVDAYTKLGALGISLLALIWVVVYLLRTYLPEQRKEFTKTLDKIVERSEAHDEARREDSKAFRATISELANTCRQSREWMQRNCSKREE